MTEQQLAQIVKWTQAEYARRTRLLKKGEGSIGWVVPAYRVTLTEIRTYAESIGVAINIHNTTDILNALNRKQRGS